MLREKERTPVPASGAPDRKNFSVAFHQALSLLRERERVERSEIVSTLSMAGCFAAIEPGEWETLLDEMIDAAFLEIAGGRIQLGPATEQTFGFASYRDFYSVFTAESGWTVKHGSTRVGNLPIDFPLPQNKQVQFVLAGSWWRAVSIDTKAMVVQVDPIDGGRAPAWRGSDGDTSFEVMQRTAALLAGSSSLFITDNLRPHMQKLIARKMDSRVAPRRIVVGQLPEALEVDTYAGERVNRYLLALVLGSAPNEATGSASSKGFRIGDRSGLTEPDVLDFLRSILRNHNTRKDSEDRALQRVKTPTFGKYGAYFGPKTRIAAWRGYFTQLPHLAELEQFEVVHRSKQLL
jgi:Lhr-like helicase